MQPVLAAIAGFILCLAGAVSASAETALRTLRTADDARGWEAVGRLDFGEDGFCTGALVAADIVLTAAHCLFDGDTGARIDPGDIRFRAGLRFGRADAHRGIRRIVIHPAYTFPQVARLDRVAHDLALLELDHPIRNGHVRPFRTRSGIDRATQVQVVSYARDRAAAPSREATCDLLTRDAQVLVLSCSVDFGSSGAPVFAVSGGEAHIVSVISAKATWKGRDVSLAAVTGDAFDTLMAQFVCTPSISLVGKRLAVTGAQSVSGR